MCLSEDKYSLNLRHPHPWLFFRALFARASISICNLQVLHKQYCHAVDKLTFSGEPAAVIFIWAFIQILLQLVLLLKSSILNPFNHMCIWNLSFLLTLSIFKNQLSLQSLIGRLVHECSPRVEWFPEWVPRLVWGEQV